MNHDPIDDLAIAELQGLLRSERHLAEAFGWLATKATAKPLKKLCREGVTFTERRLERILEALRELNAPPRPRETKGIDGLIQDALSAASSSARGPARDAAILAAVERISHDGLAVYTTLDRYLRGMAMPRARRVIAPSIREKREAIGEMSRMARRRIIARLRRDR
jgi:ferritin-like metal-binding protein YciE